VSDMNLIQLEAVILLTLHASRVSNFPFHETLCNVFLSCSDNFPKAFE